MIRLDENDFIFTPRKDKYGAVVTTSSSATEKGQPVLVGTRGGRGERAALEPARAPRRARTTC